MEPDKNTQVDMPPGNGYSQPDGDASTFNI